MGRADGRRLGKVGGPKLGDAVDAEQAHRDRDFILKDGKAIEHRFLAACAEGPGLQLSDTDGGRPHGKRLDDIGSADEAAIDVYFGLAVDGLHDAGQDVDGRPVVIELSAPAAPCSIAMTASAAVLTPLRIIGPSQMSAIRSQVSQSSPARYSRPVELVRDGGSQLLSIWRSRLLYTAASTVTASAV